MEKFRTAMAVLANIYLFYRYTSAETELDIMKVLCLAVIWLSLDVSMINLRGEK